MVAAASSALSGISAGQLGNTMGAPAVPETAGCILRIVVDNMLYTITLDVLHQVRVLNFLKSITSLSVVK